MEASEFLQRIDEETDTRDFFKAYSTVAGKIKKLKKMKGENREKGLEIVGKAIQAMKELNDFLG